MRTIAPLMVVLALGAATLMLGMAGFGGVWGAAPPMSDAAQDTLNESADNVGPNSGPVSGPVSSGDSSIVGLIVDGLGSVVSAAAAVVVLPITLIELGFPAYFAVPVGTLAELIVGIGIIEFATNREWS